jgi:2,3-bisphosphoglycerate-independent phosphoglycerate mutase
LSNSDRTVLLCILDGWGIGDPEDREHNAISQANTPFWDYLLQNFPHTELKTSGEEVGLPYGQMGNSEVGHMTIGAGRIILQDLLRINQAISNNKLADHDILNNLKKHHTNQAKAVHLFGLCSDGGVHSHIEHLIYIAKILAQDNIKVWLHLFLDGRDVSPTSAAIYLKQIDKLLLEFKNIHIATIMGRFYAMDRDNRWSRTELACQAIIGAKANIIDNWEHYISTQYIQGIFDEFITPVIFSSYQGIKAGDSVLFANFRSDRIRQLAEFILKAVPDLAYKIGMTHYSKQLNLELNCLFPEQLINNGLGEVITKQNKKQLRIAETEKYAHVTFFFNGGREESYLGEDRILVPSLPVQTYDMQPEMSAFEVTEKLVAAIASNKYDLIVVNYANGDMVGHSGKMKASIEAVEALDACLKKVYHAIEKINGIMLITSDHGNVECVFDKKNNEPYTSHTTNPVPLVLAAKDLFQKNLILKKGNLSNIAPTILQIMKIKQPLEMTAKSLFEEFYEKN